MPRFIGIFSFGRVHTYRLILYSSCNPSKTSSTKDEESENNSPAIHLAEILVFNSLRDC